MIILASQVHQKAFFEQKVDSINNPTHESFIVT